MDEPAFWVGASDFLIAQFQDSSLTTQLQTTWWVGHLKSQKIYPVAY